MIKKMRIWRLIAIFFIILSINLFWQVYRLKRAFKDATPVLESATTVLLHNEEKMHMQATELLYALNIACSVAHKGEFKDFSETRLKCTLGSFDITGIPLPMDSKAQDKALGHPEHDLTL